MAEEHFPWLIFPPAIDLANTVRVTPAGERELLVSEEQFDAWVAAERGRIAGVEAASGRLTEVRELRDSVRSLLHARARGRRPPDEARRRVNSIAASAPLRSALTAAGRVVEEPASDDPYAVFEATVARSAIELSGRGEEAVGLRGAELRDVVPARSPAPGLVLEGVWQPRARRPTHRPSAGPDGGCRGVALRGLGLAVGDAKPQEQVRVRNGAADPAGLHSTIEPSHGGYAANHVLGGELRLLVDVDLRDP